MLGWFGLWVVRNSASWAYKQFAKAAHVCAAEQSVSLPSAKKWGVSRRIARQFLRRVNWEAVEVRLGTALVALLGR